MKKMYEILSKYSPKNEPAKIIGSNESYPIIQSNNSGLLWDQKNCGLGLQFESKGALVMLK